MMNKISQILDIDLKSIGQLMKRKGRYGDTELAHITPEQANFLLSLGGAGTINPATGLPEFYEDYYGSYDSEYFWNPDPIYSGSDIQIYKPAPIPQDTYLGGGEGIVLPADYGLDQFTVSDLFKGSTGDIGSFDVSALPADFTTAIQTDIANYTGIVDKYSATTDAIKKEYEAIAKEFAAIETQTKALKDLNTTIQKQQKTAQDAKKTYDAAYAEYVRQSNSKDAGTIAGRKAMIMRSYGQSDPPNFNKNGYWEIVNANKALSDLKTKATNAANAVNTANKAYSDSVKKFNADQKALLDLAKKYEEDQAQLKKDLEEAKKLADAAAAEKTRLEGLAKTEAERIATEKATKEAEEKAAQETAAKAEQDRIAAEQKFAADAQAKAEADRAAAEAAAKRDQELAGTFGDGGGTASTPGEPGRDTGGGTGPGDTTFPGPGGPGGGGGTDTGGGGSGGGDGSIIGPTSPTEPTFPTTPVTPIEPVAPVDPEPTPTEPIEQKEEEPKKDTRSRRLASALSTPLGGTPTPGGGAVGSTAALGAALSIQPDVATTGQEEKKEKGTERELVWNEASLRNILGI